MTSDRVSNSPRYVKSGAVDKATGTYELTLDTGVIVYTQDLELAKAAKAALDAKTAMIFTIEPGEKPRLTEMTPAPPDAKPANETAVATRPAAAVTTVEPKALPAGLITNPQELAKQIAGMRTFYHVLGDMVVSGLGAGWGANLASVHLDSSGTFDDKGNFRGSDTYFSKSIHGGDRNLRSPSKQGLIKLATAMGVQWEKPTRYDDGKTPNFWAVFARGRVSAHDGRPIFIQAARDLDLRDGSAEAAGMTPAQLLKARAMGQQNCESKAMLRAIRNLPGIKTIYTIKELEKPFLVMRFSYVPDMEDPAIKLLVTKLALEGMSSMYGETSAPPPPPALVSAPPLAALPPAAEDPFAAPPQVSSPVTTAAAGDPTVRILKVDTKHGTNKKTDKPWTIYTVTFGPTGEMASTFSETLHAIIDRAYAEKLPVSYTTSEGSPGYEDRLETLTILEDAGPPPLPDEDADL